MYLLSHVILEINTISREFNQHIYDSCGVFSKLTPIINLLFGTCCLYVIGIVYFPMLM